MRGIRQVDRYGRDFLRCPGCDNRLAEAGSDGVLLWGRGWSEAGGVLTFSRKKYHPVLNADSAKMAYRHPAATVAKCKCGEDVEII